MPNTHCLPSGSLGTSELPCPSVSAPYMTTYVPASGSKRGVVVLMQGLGVVALDVPQVPTASVLTFAQSLQTDGWVVLAPTYAENMKGSLPTTGLYNDVNADAGHGSRYLAQMLNWWDHIIAYIQKTYGNWPVVPFGFSWGGWHTTKIAKSKLSTIVGYGMHVPVTLLSGVAASFTSPTDFTGLNTTGLDTASMDLDSATVPGIIGWGTSDTTVGSTNPQALYNAASGAGRPVTSNAVAEAHTFSATDATTYQSWFTSTLDPSYPKVF